MTDLPSCAQSRRRPHGKDDKPKLDRFLIRLFWLTLATALVILLWCATPDLSGWFASAPDTSPRLVTPRGELAADEKATIELFEKSKDRVYITTRAQVMDLWSRNVFSVRAARAPVSSGTMPAMSSPTS